MKKFKVYINYQSNDYRMDDKGLIEPNGILWDEQIVYAHSREEAKKEIEQQFKNDKFTSCWVTKIEEINS